MPPEARGKHLNGNPLIELDSWNGTANVWTDYVFVDRTGGRSPSGPLPRRAGAGHRQDVAVHRARARRARR